MPAATELPTRAEYATIDREPCFGLTRAAALERASDYIRKAEDGQHPEALTFAYAWIAYANAYSSAVREGMAA